MDALIVGTGPNAKEEAKHWLKKFKQKHAGLTIFAVNWARRDNVVSTCQYIVSLHPPLLKEMNVDVWPYTISYQDASINIPLHDSVYQDLTSGMYAIKVAMMMGYENIYVAGVPLDDPAYDRKFLQSKLDDLKEELYNVYVPDNYWWKKFTEYRPGWGDWEGVNVYGFQNKI